MNENYFAGGVLFHAESGRVLLQFRGDRTPHDPGQWCLFGGWREDEDGGDPLATWVREMREELGVVIEPQRVESLRAYRPSGNRYRHHVFWCDWPTAAQAFVVPADEEDIAEYGWFTLEDALALPNLMKEEREDLAIFRERIHAQTRAL